MEGPGGGRALGGPPAGFATPPADDPVMSRAKQWARMGGSGRPPLNATPPPTADSRWCSSLPVSPHSWRVAPGCCGRCPPQDVHLALGAPELQLRACRFECKGETRNG